MALAAALAQVLASIVLGMAKLERFHLAAAEPAAPYLVVAALIAIAGLCVWMVRERLAIAAPLTVAAAVGIWAAMRSRTTGLGLAYHGEFVLHHFSALLCLVVAVSLPIAWARDPRLGKARALPALLAIPGALMLAAAHLGDVPFGPAALSSRQLAATGAATLLAAWPVSAALFWTKLAPAQRRPLVWILLLPLAARLAFSGWAGLAGELVSDAGIPWVGAAIVVTAVGALVLLRPRIEIWVLLVVGLICMLGSGFFYVLYKFRFGELEDDLGGLLQSLFGFVVPYPSYVDHGRLILMIMGLFFAFVTVYAALVSTEDRIRGVALGLMLIAGVGFSSPHLVLMLGVGALLFVETLLPGAPERELRPRYDSDELAAIERALADDADDDDERPEQGQRADDDGSSGDADLPAQLRARLPELRALLDALAERLGLDPPIEVTLDSDEIKLGLRGEVDGPVVDLRAISSSAATIVELSVGLPGRGEPVFELIPDPGDRGQRPAHLIARSHRIHGQLRALEELGDAPLDALSSFPSAHLRAWYGGMLVAFGRARVAELSVDTLDALIRALVRALQRPEN